MRTDKAAMLDGCGFINVDGVRLEYQRWAGRLPPILLLHEALGSISIWREFPAELASATGHEVVAWSRAGHGGSDLPMEARRPDYLVREARLLPEVMDALAIPSAHLFGHSDGASIALVTASLFPDRILSLVLEAPHVHVGGRAVEAIKAAQLQYETTDLPQRLQRHHRDIRHVFSSWHDLWVSEEFRDWSIESFISSVRAPTLIIQGEQDEYYTMDHVELIMKKLSTAKLLALAECRHSPHRDQRSIVLSATTRFTAAATRSAGRACGGAHAENRIGTAGNRFAK